MLSKRRLVRRAESTPELQPKNLTSNPTALNSEVSRKIFSALPEKGIRLVVIQAGSSSDEIRCDIQEVTLTDSLPPYNALSHLWGSDREHELIRLKGEGFYVRKNLAETLRQLRRADQDVVFWIDALCINQCDKDEKGVQIPLMGDVYRNAEKVVAFLGLHDESSPLLFEALEELERQPDIGHLLGHLGFDKLPSIMTAMNAFLAREYWSRAWVVQELIFGRRDRRIQCSSNEVSFSALETLRSAIINRPVNLTLSSGSPNHTAVMAPPTKWHPRFEQLQETGLTLSANGFLDGFLDSQCSHPHDHIYAFYNLFPEKLRDHIEVNVKKEPIEVICQVVQAIIKESRSLHIITLRGRQVRPVDLWQYNLPSWCPFFGVEFLNDPILSQFFEDPACSSNVEGIPTFSENGKRLKVKGVMIGEIYSTASTRPLASRPFKEIDFEDNERINTEWIYASEYIEFILSQFIGYDGLLQIDLCDGLADLPGCDFIPAIVESQFEFSKFRSMLKSNVDLMCSLYDFAQFFHARKPCAFRYDGSVLHQQHHSISPGRSPIPKDLAIVPETACANDVLCAIHGCEPFIVLRKDGECYKVVGEAKVFRKTSSDALAFTGLSRSFLLK
ncbi:heterokaryon incompatibility protein-domain-containing protein [Aspergillus bertholletiae]|uniref:Heterokaryon incompatibility protein-domain-containing protein n=1 Tax=Aspergillus bertholletiae TaxID=1226010 RepID=A0A5N7B610_9EURO|nr:heterokaryon incompatibility protein-domain-containing protein [Aspergillus bertholletiae]